MSDTKKTVKAAGTAYENAYKEKATCNMVAKHAKADMQVVYIGPELKNIISRNTIFKKWHSNRNRREAFRNATCYKKKNVYSSKKTARSSKESGNRWCI